MSWIARLMVVFTVLPILEITLLMYIHSAMGMWTTLGVVLGTATLGTVLSRWQGKAALDSIKRAIQEGQLPGDEIVDGVLVLVAGVLLITPGVITDTTGLLLLIPSLRRPVRGYLKRRFLSWLDQRARSYVSGGEEPWRMGGPAGGEVIDITPPASPNVP